MNRVQFQRRPNKRQDIGKQINSRAFCAGCFSLGKQLNVFINFKHKPSDCPRQDAVVRVLQADADTCPSEGEDDTINEEGKNDNVNIQLPPIISLQTEHNMDQKPMSVDQDLPCFMNDITYTKYRDDSDTSHILKLQYESHFSDLYNKIQAWK